MLWHEKGCLHFFFVYIVMFGEESIIKCQVFQVFLVAVFVFLLPPLEEGEEQELYIFGIYISVKSLSTLIIR